MCGCVKVLCMCGGVEVLCGVCGGFVYMSGMWRFCVWVGYVEVLCMCGLC